MEILETLRNFRADLTFSDSFRKTGFPGFKSLTSVIVDYELLMGLVCTGLESSSELETANFGQIFQDRNFLCFVVHLSDIILGEAISILSRPDGNVDIGGFIVNQMVQPDQSVSCRTSFSSCVEFEYN